MDLKPNLIWLKKEWLFWPIVLKKVIHNVPYCRCVLGAFETSLDDASRLSANLFHLTLSRGYLRVCIWLKVPELLYHFCNHHWQAQIFSYYYCAFLYGPLAFIVYLRTSHMYLPQKVFKNYSTCPWSPAFRTIPKSNQNNWRCLTFL